jgi:hypothetical protein
MYCRKHFIICFCLWTPTCPKLVVKYLIPCRKKLLKLTHIHIHIQTHTHFYKPIASLYFIDGGGPKQKTRENHSGIKVNCHRVVFNWFLWQLQPFIIFTCWLYHQQRNVWLYAKNMFNLATSLYSSFTEIPQISHNSILLTFSIPSAS